MKALIIFILVICPSLFAGVQACELTLTHPLRDNDKEILIVELLKLSLTKVDSSICFKELDETLTDAREVMYVAKNRLSLKWGSAGSYKVEGLLAVEVPIFRGLGGYRVLVIRQGEQARFSKVKTVNDLQAFTVGQGAFWGDTRILEHAGFTVEKSTQARNLWKMLHAKRFDFISLGVHEPWDEVAQRPELAIAVEPNILLIYPSAFYFYVNQANFALHQLIAQGMQLALNDGSYYQTLIHSKLIQDMLRQANLSQRYVIEIDNPFIDVNQMAKTELLYQLVSLNSSKMNTNNSMQINQ
ncbi:hypothetical protein [Catenovulum agarivorans]|uniref:hypothetical protein n=1 Tax=Catenovulum agarivorans TaxID=1172192 RepID=UPI0002E8CFFD|nr:hypothetical protein [Catenovulum agarivorans]